MATYLTDFIDLSNLLAGLLPGDSFLLRRKASRFFMSLALGERKVERGRELAREGEGFMETEGKRRWVEKTGQRRKGKRGEVDKRRQGKKVC